MLVFRLFSFFNRALSSISHCMLTNDQGQTIYRVITKQMFPLLNLELHLVKIAQISRQLNMIDVVDKTVSFKTMLDWGLGCELFLHQFSSILVKYMAHTSFVWTKGLQFQQTLGHSSEKRSEQLITKHSRHFSRSLDFEIFKIGSLGGGGCATVRQGVRPLSKGDTFRFFQDAVCGKHSVWYFKAVD